MSLESKGPPRSAHASIVVNSLKHAALELPEGARAAWLRDALELAQFIVEDPSLSNGLAQLQCVNGSFTLLGDSNISMVTKFMSSSLNEPPSESKFIRPLRRKIVFPSIPFALDGTVARINSRLMLTRLGVDSIGKLVDSFADTLLGLASAPTGDFSAQLGPISSDPVLALEFRNATVAALSEGRDTRALNHSAPLVAVLTDAMGYADAKAVASKFNPVHKWLFTVNQTDYKTPINPDVYPWTVAPTVAALQGIYGGSNAKIAAEIARMI